MMQVKTTITPRARTTRRWSRPRCRRVRKGMGRSSGSRCYSSWVHLRQLAGYEMFRRNGFCNGDALAPGTAPKGRTQRSWRCGTRSRGWAVPVHSLPGFLGVLAFHPPPSDPRVRADCSLTARLTACGFSHRVAAERKKFSAGNGAPPPHTVCEFFTAAGRGFGKTNFDGAQVTRSGTIKRSEFA
jgi:hypothetical protein